MRSKIYFVLLVLSLTFIAGCIPSQTPQIVFLNTDVSFLSFDTMQAKSHFTVKNPNPVPLRGMMEYDLFIKGNKFLSGSSNPIDMPANGETSFTLDSKVNMVKVYGVLSDLVKEIEAGKSSVPFEINGKFKSDILNIPIEVPVKVSGDLPLPKLPKLDFQGASFSSVSLDGTTLKIKLRVKNENSFPIKVDPFPYTLIADGKELASGSVDQTIQIAANQEKEIAINLKVNFSQLGEAIINQIKADALRAEVKSSYNQIR
jgi:LEA14-like dessication related protein